MAHELCREEQDDSGRGDWETRKAWTRSRRVRALRSEFSALQLKVVHLTYFEGMSVDETALVLRISESGVKKILWEVTDRFCQQLGLG